MFTFTVYDLLSKNLPSRADHPAVVDGDDEVTYCELSRRVDALASWLHVNGVARGDRVGIHIRKSVEEVVATFAVARIGAVFVNVNHQRTAPQLKYIVDDCGIRVLLTDRRKARLIEKDGWLDELEAVVVVGGGIEHPNATAWSDLPDDWTAPPPAAISVDLGALLYTSGSTGQPKGVMLSHQNIVHGARSVACYLKNTPDDRILGLLPMSFDYGMSQVTTAFLVGATVVLQPVVMPAEIARTLVEKNVTGLASVPPSWIQIVRYLEEQKTPLPSLRYVTNSGGKIPAPILDAMPRVFPGVDIVLMYGLTEAFRSTFLPPELFEAKKGSIGRAIPDAEMFVVDPDKGVCGPDEQGELVHRGALISMGYWGKPEATEDKLKVCDALVPLIGQEKVLYSGDLVRRDADGILWFVSRIDSMIKCSGFRLSPTEVEEVVFASGLVSDVVAFGVEDEMLGQVVHVAVATGDGSEADRDALSKYCQHNMPAYMVPREIHTWQGQMPRTSSGKIDRPSVVVACASDEQA